MISTSGVLLEVKAGGGRWICKDHLYFCTWEGKYGLFQAEEFRNAHSGRQTICFVPLGSSPAPGFVLFDEVVHICHE